MKFPFNVPESVKLKCLLFLVLLSVLSVLSSKCKFILIALAMRLLNSKLVDELGFVEFYLAELEFDELFALERLFVVVV